MVLVSDSHTVFGFGLGLDVASWLAVSRFTPGSPRPTGSQAPRLNNTSSINITKLET